MWPCAPAARQESATPSIPPNPSFLRLHPFVSDSDERTEGEGVRVESMESETPKAKESIATCKVASDSFEY